MVSVIIPVFNVEKYISGCLESVLGQTYTNIEVIVVNDGSSDSSYSECNKYLFDPRVKVYSKPNGGVSSARNFGLSLAQGAYVIFVDADDIIPADTILQHINHMSNEMDLTLGGIDFFQSDSVSLFTLKPENDEIKSVGECLYDFTPNGGVDWQRYMVNRMMRMSIIKEHNLRFNEKIAYKEDGLFLVQYLLKCKGKVAYFPDIVYKYRQNPNSAMGALNSGRTEKLVTNIDAHALIIKEMRAADVPSNIINREITHALRSRFWVMNILKQGGQYSRKKDICAFLKILRASGIKYSFGQLKSHIKTSCSKCYEC